MPQLPQCSGRRSMMCSGAACGPCAPAARLACPAGCVSSAAPAACCCCRCRGLPAAPIPPIAAAASRSPPATRHSPPPAARLRQAGAALWGASPVPCGLRRAPRGVGTKPPRDDSQRTPMRRLNRPSTTFPSRYVLKAAVKGGYPAMQMSPQWMSAGSIPAPWVLTVRSTHLRHALGTLIHLSTAPEYQRGTWAVTQYESIRISRMPLDNSFAAYMLGAPVRGFRARRMCDEDSIFSQLGRLCDPCLWGRVAAPRGLRARAGCHCNPDGDRSRMPPGRSSRERRWSLTGDETGVHDRERIERLRVLQVSIAETGAIHAQCRAVRLCERGHPRDHVAGRPDRERRRLPAAQRCPRKQSRCRQPRWLSTRRRPT